MRASLHPSARRLLLSDTTRCIPRAPTFTLSQRHYASPSGSGAGRGGGHDGSASPPPPPQPQPPPGDAREGVAANQAGPGSQPRRRRRGGVASDVGLAAAALLPPLPLYRRILHAHKQLPLEMKSLGDTYVRDEFRRHAEIDNPLQIVGFLTQWKVYLDGLEQQQQGERYRGKQLNVQQFEKLSDEQLYQLHELMGATRELYDPEHAQAQPPGGNQAVHDAVESALQRTRDAAGNGGRGSGNGDAGR